MAGNSNLQAAKHAANDEFYTQYNDIQREINAYVEYNPNAFRGKTVLLPCDDPDWSNFTRFFAQNFEQLGLKKLISTSYAPTTKKEKYGLYHQMTIFELMSPQYDEDMSMKRGRILVLEKKKGRKSAVNFADLEWEYLEGDGDFRSDEVLKLRDEADIIVTNPPFSLFKEFIDWIVSANKKFLVIGNQNAVTYKEIFPLFRDNLIWWGAGDCVRWFVVPDEIQIKTKLNDNGERIAEGARSRWFTNIDHGRRHEPLSLMTMADNLRFSKHKEVRENGYLPYDNFDGIEVPFTDAIPSDYPGAMGVPITFLDKFNPEQFELIDATERWSSSRRKKYSIDEYSNANDLNATWVIIKDGVPTKGYKRLLIRYTEQWKANHPETFGSDE